MKERLIQAREWAGLSQGQAAKLLMIQREDIRIVEEGKASPHPDFIKELAKLYKVNPLWLAGEEITLNMSDQAIEQFAKMKPGDREDLLNYLVAVLVKKEEVNNVNN